MIKIRKLCPNDMKQAIGLKILCWPEELNHYSESVSTPILTKLNFL
ncbi:hypothetical protein acsn021_33820 [Anaerocolumna cellulosilytica]|uniref:Uncharacterized protein n=1 Tax=Anaerocolumna cellulosilytica TaxID=433286 RepID=A0A6S6QX68_9FIRM|nr:hypothetical protein [Anaerocolumna cellulosilytica]MBB5196793.1 hypothetical protein [Anaerocolumna cellulosilytica]BCJ95813.1 hypothetical protein acsn021_33820 [Anaerocolumna cellulosilytica]